jgi:hypothetical protein
MYWAVRGVLRNLEVVWISNNKHLHCRNIQTWFCWYVCLKPNSTKAPRTQYQHHAYYSLLYLTYIMCWLLLRPKQLQLNLSEPEIVQRKLSLKYQCSVRTINCSAWNIQNSASLKIYLSRTSMLPDFANANLRNWLLHLWQESDQNVLTLMDGSELQKMQISLPMFYLC